MAPFCSLWERVQGLPVIGSAENRSDCAASDTSYAKLGLHGVFAVQGPPKFCVPPAEHKLYNNEYNQFFEKKEVLQTSLNNTLYSSLYRLWLGESPPRKLRVAPASDRLPVGVCPPLTSRIMCMCVLTGWAGMTSSSGSEVSGSRCQCPKTRTEATRPTMKKLPSSYLLAPKCAWTPEKLGRYRSMPRSRIR